MSSAAAQLPTLAPVAVLTPLPTDHWRPATRGECEHGPRPCPYVGCRHHLYLEVRPESGELALTFPDLNPDELADTCALDVAERGGCGGLTLDEVGERLGVTRQRVQQVERKALLRAREAIRRLGLRAEQLLPDLETDDEQDQDGEREQGRDEQGERGGEDHGDGQAPEPRPSPTEGAGLRWFGEPADEGEEAEAGRLFWDSLRPRVQAGPRVFGKQEQEQEGTMQESEQESRATSSVPETTSEATATLCPCGCGRPVRPGRAYASRGCSGRHRWAVAQTEGRSATTPAPLALCPCGCGGKVAPGATYASRSCDRRAMQQRVAELEERNEELRLQLATQLATVREETARRCEQEAAALTTLLEAAEAENARLLASLHEEQRQRVAINQALMLPGQTDLASVLTTIEAILDCEQQGKDREQEAAQEPSTVGASGFLVRVNLIAQMLGLPAGKTYLLDEIERRISALRLAEADASSLRAERVQVEEAAGVVVGAVTLGELLRKIEESTRAAGEYALLNAYVGPSRPKDPAPDCIQRPRVPSHQERLLTDQLLSLQDGLRELLGITTPLTPADGVLLDLLRKRLDDPDPDPLPHPEALPTGYAFEVAEYVSDLAERLMGQKP